MKLVTFNIRCDCDQGTINSFENRKEPIRNKIREEDIDIVGFQEVLPHVAQWLRDALPGYDVLSCGRGPQYEDEAMTILFRRERFHLLRYETFWLSDTENIPGSRYQQQSICPRICSFATFYERKSERCFTLFNTHLDHESESARIKGMGKILETMKKDRHPVLLTGDLNTFPGSGVTQLIQASGLPLTDVTQNSGTTFHDYGKAEEKLDYIYIGREFTCKGLQKWTGQYNGVHLSDHYPLCAEIEWAISDADGCRLLSPKNSK